MSAIIAFVTPWYGPDVPGGAESLTRRTAEQLHQAGLPVEILTTTIRDLYADWGHNHHKAGVSQINGVTVRRFPVLKRDKQAFNALNARLMKGLTITADQQKLYINEMMRVPKLYDYIQKNCQNYLFIFVPYMFATTYFGAQICPQRSLMIPCLHDEAYAYLDIYKTVLTSMRALIFNGEAEEVLYERIFSPNGGQIREVLGIGVETDFVADGARFRQKYELHDPFMLYVGRRESGKNTPLLAQYWQRYVNETGRQAKLVLMGPGHISLPDSPHIVDVGFVPVQDKYDALAAADIFCMPSVNESFSLATMESWLAGTPALVHGDCAVTREHCVKANGGLYFVNYDEFVATTDYLFDHPQTAVTLAQQGRQYVLENYRWPTVIGRYQQLINKVLEEVKEE